MTDTAALHGRTRELARLELAIGMGTDGLRLVRVRGAAGIGKSILVARATSEAEELGFLPISIRGRAGSLTPPLAPLAEEFSALDEQLEAQRRDGQPIDLDQAAISVRADLVARCAQHPRLLVVEDARSLDASSLALLATAMAFEQEPNLTVVLVEQTDVAELASYAQFVTTLGEHASVLSVDLDPLTDAAIVRVVADALELDDVDAVPAAIVERAAGNPWFARELAAAWQRGERDVPRNIAAAALSILQALPAAAREMVRLCALCPDGAHRAWLEALLDDASDVTSIQQAEHCGIVTVIDDILSVQHPLMRASVIEDMSVALRRVLHRELAEAIEAVSGESAVAVRASAQHLAAGGRPHDAVVRYQAAASASEQQGLPHEAYVALMSALGCETRVRDRVALLSACARAASYLGVRDAVHYWSELVRLAASTNDDELYAYALVQQYWASHDGTALNRLSHAANLGSDRIGWSARAAATLARLDGRLSDAIEHDSFAVDVARTHGDAELEVVALEKLASSHGLLGNTADAIGTCRTAIERAIAERLHDAAALSWGCLVETLSEELRNEEAISEAQAADVYLTSVGLSRKRPALLAWQTTALLRRGDLVEAKRVAEQALALDQEFRSDATYGKEHFGALVALVRAEVANEAGDANAGEYADQAAAKIEELGYHSWSLEAGFERARAIARRDGIDAALPFVANVHESGEPAFVANVARWLTRVAAVSNSPAALARVRALRAVDYAWTTTAVSQLIRDEIDAVLAAVEAHGSIEELAAIAARWRSAVRELDALRVEAVIGAVLLARGEVDRARAVLRSTFGELSKRCAAGDVNTVAALLRRAGSRTRAAIRLTDVGSLTQRELEIARLAAGGSRNRDIAGILSITENTVTAHLTSVYEKTEIRSRVRLAHWLREHDLHTTDVREVSAV